MRDFDEWLSKFRASISSYDYYIDFEKVVKNVEEIKVELNILNTLIGSKNIEEDFEKIMTKYPETLQCIPLLLAVRGYEIYAQDEDGAFLYNFKKMNYSVEQYKIFMRKTGLFDMIANHLVNNLVDYALGIETGLDSNGRKNRGGHQMEDLVEKYIVAAGFKKDVEECADILTALGIKVFYDSYEQDVLWGKDLYTFLADIYSNKARYAIVFISQHYVKKCWTKHEFKFINERMFNSETEYLLPVFLDDTKLCGIPETQGYLTNKTPYEVAVMFAKKINKDIDVELMKSELQQSLPTYEITVRGRNVRFYSAVEEFDAEYPLSFLMELYKLDMLYDLFILPALVPN